MWEVQLGPHYSSQTPRLCPIHNWGPLARILISQRSFGLPQGNLTAFSYCSFSKRRENSRKTSTSALLITPKPLTVWITTNCGKFLKKWEHQITLLVSWELCMQVKKQQLELNMEQQIGSKSGKEYIKAVYCHPAYLTYLYAEYIMWNAGLDEAQAEIKIVGRNINNLRYTDDTTLWQKAKRKLKTSWWNWNRTVKKLA